MREHTLVLKRDGSIDYWAFDNEPHNGPRCEACGDVWCEHCQQHEPWSAEECPA